MSRRGRLRSRQKPAAAVGSLVSWPFASIELPSGCDEIDFADERRVIALRVMRAVDRQRLFTDCFGRMTKRGCSFALGKCGIEKKAGGCPEHLAETERDAVGHSQA